MATGLTFLAYLSDDGTNPIDLGKKVNLGFTVKRLNANESFDIDTAAGAEQTVSVTLGAATNTIAIGSLAIALANLDSAVVGDLIGVRLRRKATDTVNDTAPGNVVLYRCDVNNT